MHYRAFERGNTILIATVLILGLTVMGLGVAKFVRTSVSNAADRQAAGYPAIQALYWAELGVNNFMWTIRNNPDSTDPPLTSGPSTRSVTVDYSPTFQIKPVLRYIVERNGLPAEGVWPYKSVATVTSGVGGTVQRTVTFSVQHNGNKWVLQDYAYE